MKTLYLLISLLLLQPIYGSISSYSFEDCEQEKKALEQANTSLENLKNSLNLSSIQGANPDIETIDQLIEEPNLISQIIGKLQAQVNKLAELRNKLIQVLKEKDIEVLNQRDIDQLSDYERRNIGPFVAIYNGIYVGKQGQTHQADDRVIQNWLRKINRIKRQGGNEDLKTAIIAFNDALANTNLPMINNLIGQLASLQAAISDVNRAKKALEDCLKKLKDEETDESSHQNTIQPDQFSLPKYSFSIGLSQQFSPFQVDPWADYLTLQNEGDLLFSLNSSTDYLLVEKDYQIEIDPTSVLRGELAFKKLIKQHFHLVLGLVYGQFEYQAESKAMRILGFGSTSGQSIEEQLGISSKIKFIQTKLGIQYLIVRKSKINLGLELGLLGQRISQKELYLKTEKEEIVKLPFETSKLQLGGYLGIDFSWKTSEILGLSFRTGIDIINSQRLPNTGISLDILL